MKKIREYVNNQNGAASILVILLMVVFSVLGLLAMLYAHNNYSLSLKTQEWHEEYFELDGIAELLLAQMDGELTSIDRNSISTMDHEAKVTEYFESFALTLPENTKAEILPYEKGYVDQKVIAITISGENNTLYVEILPLYSELKPYRITAWHLLPPTYTYEYDPYEDWALVDVEQTE